ncbi:hypothetical protein [Oceanisphaera pacifica]|uniref:Uncharacterized protein n=1 Tax=Oceanisphaera pacifica TaxID=2818389 RepID=A0ABS3NHF5_9GAMM|nr:hypothetical protein [Oceanisphaera pacifica]MBO1520002.1 hypothetical protein [Oceanisphaera pacifica]
MNCSYLYSLITFIVIFATGSYYTYLQITAERSELKRSMGDISNAQPSNIERRLRHSLSTTYILLVTASKLAPSGFSAGYPTAMDGGNAEMAV